MADEVASSRHALLLISQDSSLVRRGFVLRQRLLFEWGLLHADLWEWG
jgi:hypothetical protein